MVSLAFVPKKRFSGTHNNVEVIQSDQVEIRFIRLDAHWWKFNRVQ